MQRMYCSASTKHKAPSTQKQLNKRHEPAHARMLPGPGRVCMRHVRSAALNPQVYKIRTESGLGLQRRRRA